jgi:hypothetical protein
MLSCQAFINPNKMNEYSFSTNPHITCQGEISTPYKNNEAMKETYSFAQENSK